MTKLSGEVRDINEVNGVNYEDMTRTVMQRQAVTSTKRTIKAKRMKEYFDGRRKVATEYEPGDLILRRDSRANINIKG